MGRDVASSRCRVELLAALGVTMIWGCGTGILSNRCLVNSDCDDGMFCNGLEYCSVDTDEAMRCFSRENPCNNPVGCNEETDQCELD